MCPSKGVRVLNGIGGTMSEEQWRKLCEAERDANSKKFDDDLADKLRGRFIGGRWRWPSMGQIAAVRVEQERRNAAKLKREEEKREAALARAKARHAAARDRGET